MNKKHFETPTKFEKKTWNKLLKHEATKSLQHLNNEHALNTQKKHKQVSTTEIKHQQVLIATCTFKEFIKSIK